MLDVRYLQDKIRELEKRKANLQGSINRRRKHIGLMPMSDVRRDSQHYELEEEEVRLNELEEQIADFQRGMLYKSLLSLDYRHHTELFQSFSRTYHIGAFILHGSVKSDHDYRGYSVRALLKRLVDSTPNSAVTLLIHRDLSSPMQSTNINALWRSLAAEVKLGTDAQREDIIKQVCRKLEIENVILVFRGVDHIPETHLDSLIRDFWGPLATAAHIHPSNRHLLLMFLVDYSGRVKDWKISCIERPDEAWKPDIPIRLPIVTTFSERDLSGWIEQWSETLFDILSNDLRQGPLEYRVQNILDKSNNGDPDLVMWHICNQCGQLLEGAEECLRL